MISALKRRSFGNWLVVWLAIGIVVVVTLFFLEVHNYNVTAGIADDAMALVEKYQSILVPHQELPVY